MIFHDLKAIFIHNERTGGVSVRKHLLHYETNFERIGSTKHYTAEETAQRVGYIWKEYLTFGFVRNPYERLLSWYLACRKYRHKWRGNELADYFIQFENFHDLVMAKPHERILIPQHKKVEGLDFIGRFENYEKDFEELCTKYLSIPYKYIKINDTFHKSYRDFYTVKMKRKVREWYKEDLERFEYEF
jgi:hypothetical protein